MAPFFLLSPWENRGGGQGASAALGRRPWASGTAGVMGKRGRATWEVDPLPRFEEMVARRGGSTAAGGSRRWRAWGRRHGARRRAGPGGKRRRGSRGSQSLPWLGPRGSRERSSAVAGGCTGERRRCKLGEGGWRWQWGAGARKKLCGGGGGARGGLFIGEQGGAGLAGRRRRSAAELMVVGAGSTLCGRPRRAEVRCAPVMRRLDRRRCASSMTLVGGEVMRGGDRQAALCRGRRRCAPGRRRARAGQSYGRRRDASWAEASGAGRWGAARAGAARRPWRARERGRRQC